MTDIHCHILPAIDDGAASLEVSLAMARLSAASGVDTIIATPHFGCDDVNAKSRADMIREKGELLRSALRENNIPITLYTGAEIGGASALDPARLRRGELPTLNGTRYMLCEFHFDDPSIPVMDRVLHSMLAEGIVPILAHPERYEAVVHDPRVVLRWRNDGCGIQVNKASVNGLFGKQVQNAVLWFLDHRLVTAVATDSHETGERRAPQMDRLRDTLEARLGRDYTRLLLCDNPQNIIHDRPLQDARK